MHDRVKPTNPSDEKQQLLLCNDGAAAVEDQLLLVVSAFPTWIDSEREGECKREKDELLVINSKPQIYLPTGMGGGAQRDKENTDIM